MIRLRRQIERGLRHPLAGPLLLLLIAALVVFVALHELTEGLPGDTALACVALALALLAAVPPAVSGTIATRHGATRPSRAPPVESGGPVALALHSLDFIPLRR